MSAITRRELDDAIDKARQVLVVAEELEDTVDDFTCFLRAMQNSIVLAAARHRDALSEYWETKL